MITPFKRRPVGVKWVLFVFSWDNIISPAKLATVAILPSAVIDEHFARCKSAFPFQPVLPPDWRLLFVVNDEVGQALDAVAGTRLVDLAVPFSEGFVFYAAAGLLYL